MIHSNKKPALGKPKKPREDFPLFAHNTKRWAKKIRGKLHYFGPWDNPDAALALYLKQKDWLHAGLTPPREEDEEKTLGNLCNSFLTDKLLQVESGDITRRSFLDYKRTCDFIIAEWGKHRRVDDLQHEDFNRFRVKLSRRLGPSTLGNEINRIRIVFRYACEEKEMVNKSLKKLVGKSFVKPPKRILTLARKKNGERMLEAAQIRRLIDAADPIMKAVILLGVNCGYGASDIAGLRKHHLDLISAWVDYPRPKTGADRECSLWPETIAALKVAIASRPKVKVKENDDLVFLTHQGNPFVRYSPEWKNDKNQIKGNIPLDTLGRKFIKLLKTAGFHRPGLGLYTLRHVVETIGGEAKDQIALDRIMGHSDGSMAGVYRERISRERIKGVTDHIHDWLFRAVKTR